MMTTEARPVWAELVMYEPRLGDVLADARKVRVRGVRYCANAVWTSRFKPRVERLAGWYAESPELRSSAAYDVAYRTVMGAIADCPSCWCS